MEFPLENRLTDVKFLDDWVFNNRIRTQFWFSAHPYYLTITAVVYV